MNETAAKEMLRKMAGLIGEREPSTGVAFYRRGLELFRDRAFEAALNCFLNSTKIDPDFAFAFYYAGRAYRTLGRFAEARAMFERSVALNSYHAPSRAYLGDIFLKEDNLIEAEKCFRGAVDLQADNRLALASLSRLAKQGSVEKQTVIELLRAAYFQGSRDPTVLMEMFSLRRPDSEMCITLGDELFRNQSFYRAAFFYWAALDQGVDDQNVRLKYEECIELLNALST